MALSEIHDDDELERLGYGLAVDLLAEQDPEAQPVPESSKRLAPKPWHHRGERTFERHVAKPVV